MAEFILSIENQWGYWEKAISIHHAFDLTSMTHIWDKIPWKNNLENINIVQKRCVYGNYSIDFCYITKGG